MSETRAYLVPQNIVGASWEHVRPFLEQAADMSGGKYSASDILNLSMQGYNQLWLVSDGDELLAVGATEIYTYPMKKACRVVMLIGHDKKKWVHLLNEEVEPWAKGHKCNLMQVIGRPAWARTLTDYKKTQIVLEKELS